MEDYRYGKKRCNISEASRQEGSANSELKRDNDGHCARRMPKIERIPPRKAWAGRGIFNQTGDAIALLLFENRVLRNRSWLLLTGLELAYFLRWN